MSIFKKKFEVNTDGNKVTYRDITDNVKATIESSNIKEGICVVSTAHTTCSVFFEEYTHDKDSSGDDYLQVDLNNVLEKIIPKHDSEKTYLYPGEEHYNAVKSWPDVDSYLPGGDRTALWNGDAHIKSTIIGASETFEVTDGKLGVGSTGYIYLADFDQTRERTRKYVVTILGE